MCRYHRNSKERNELISIILPTSGVARGEPGVAAVVRHIGDARATATHGRSFPINYVARVRWRARLDGRD